MAVKPKVISIGNLAMGGTGKTPHVIEVASEYLKRGIKTAVISRGYKGLLGTGNNVIAADNEIFYEPPMAADEAYMIALNCPQAVVITGKKREISLSEASEKYGTELAVLDDGFQYRSLKKDADIVLLDYSNPFSTGLPFPFGYLREMPGAISRADAVIFTRAEKDSVPERAKAYVKDKPSFFSRPIYEKICGSNGEEDASAFAGARVAAFSAVASNNSFHNTLSNLGFSIKYFRGFGDHKKLSDSTVEKIIRDGRAAGAELFLTTEKDYVKLNGEHRAAFRYLKMEIEITGREDFFRLLDALTGFQSPRKLP